MFVTATVAGPGVVSAVDGFAVRANREIQRLPNVALHERGFQRVQRQRMREVNPRHFFQRRTPTAVDVRRFAVSADGAASSDA
jgi:hypothetical protein